MKLRSESLANFLPAFHKVQHSLKKVKKNRKGRFKYADLDTMMEELMPLLCENNLSISHSMCYDKDTKMFLLYSRVFHVSDEFIASLTPILISEKDMTELETGPLQQAIGSAITYQSRYATKSLFCLTLEDDSMDNDGSRGYRKKTSPSKATEKQVQLIKYKIREKNIDVTDILSHFKVTKIESLTIDQASAVIEHISKK